MFYSLHVEFFSGCIFFMMCLLRVALVIKSFHEELLFQLSSKYTFDSTMLHSFIRDYFPFAFIYVPVISCCLPSRCPLFLLHFSHIPIFLSSILFMMYSFTVAHFSSYNHHFMLQFFVANALISCCTHLRLNHFRIALFSCCFFFLLHSIHITLILCFAFLILHFFSLLHFFMLFFYQISLFSYCLFFMLHSFYVRFFHVALTLCDTRLILKFSMLDYFQVALFHFELFYARLFLTFTLYSKPHCRV